MNFVKPAAHPASRAFTLVHFSDLHLCRPAGSPPARFGNKRLLSWLSWRLRRRRTLRPQILAALVRAVGRLDADQIVVTGDLTQLALRSEFREARRLLAELGDAGRVMAVPGNHDALVPGAWEDGQTEMADYLAPPRPVAGPAAFPLLRVCGPTALIGVNTARPSPPFLAVGRIGRAQLDNLAAVLKKTADAGLFRIILIHHPPLPNAVSPHKRLLDAAGFGARLAASGAELVLHGHAHRRMQATIAGRGGPIPVLGISAASAESRKPHRRAAFRVFRIEGSRRRRRVSFQDHVHLPGTEEFVPGPLQRLERPAEQA